MRTSSILRFDRLARWLGARLDRAEEEVGHVVAEADHRRVVLAVRRTLAAGRGIGEARRSSGRAIRRIGRNAFPHGALAVWS
ncbi:MAG: hypothetical protein WB715_04650, partial [Roseiarcus sp.]|uniref:hypothetical protein n=1 Tax=Roseiarcus sp. TaxID=1969460 RepID=UPI003C3AE9D8